VWLLLFTFALVKLSGYICAPTVLYRFKDKPVHLGSAVRLCISCHYGVILTDKRIYLLFIQHYYMIRLSIIGHHEAGIGSHKEQKVKVLSQQIQL